MSIFSVTLCIYIHVYIFDMDVLYYVRGQTKTNYFLLAIIFMGSDSTSITYRTQTVQCLSYKPYVGNAFDVEIRLVNKEEYPRQSRV